MNLNPNKLQYTIPKCLPPPILEESTMADVSQKERERESEKVREGEEVGEGEAKKEGEGEGERTRNSTFLLPKGFWDPRSV